MKVGIEQFAIEGANARHVCVFAVHRHYGDHLGKDVRREYEKSASRLKCRWT